jgi:hypothetical protein
MKFKSKKQAIEAVNQGKLQISCRSKEEWDYLTKQCNLKFETISYNTYGNATVINITDKTVGTLRMRPNAISFYEWKSTQPKQCDHTIPPMQPISCGKKTLAGGWCVKNDGSDEFKTVMKIAFEKLGQTNILDFNAINNYYGIDIYGKYNLYSSVHGFNSNILTLDELKELIGWKAKQPTPDELLAEAKKRYPIGTKFYPAHVTESAKKYDRYCIVTQDSIFVSINNQIILRVNDSNFSVFNKPEYGNTQFNRVVFDNGIWATIISEPKSIEQQVSECVSGYTWKPNYQSIYQKTFEALTERKSINDCGPIQIDILDNLGLIKEWFDKPKTEAELQAEYIYDLIDDFLKSETALESFSKFKQNYKLIKLEDEK